MKRVCVYCGSSAGARPAYAEAAVGLATELAARGIGLVYGGASVGLMGEIASGVLAAGGDVIGVIPERLENKELAHSGLTELHVVGSMHERKALMVDLSDGFIAMPGGAGTLDELFETLTWSQLGLHTKPIGVLNVAGYYDGLLAFLDNAVSERFLRPPHRSMLLVGDSPARVLDAIVSYEPPSVAKWIDRDSS